MRNKDLMLGEAVRVVMTELPEKYSDARKAKLLLRSATLRGAIPGATSEILPGNKQLSWKYDRDQLVKWLENPGAHRRGRPPGSRNDPEKKVPQLQD